MKGYHHTYAIDAAQLIIECRQNLKSILIHSPRPADVNPNITDLDRTLLSTEQLVHYHLLMLIEVINDEKRLERNFDSAQNQSSSAPISLSRSTTTTLAESVEHLKRLSRKNCPRKISRSQFTSHPQNSSMKCNGESSATVKGSTEKTATDSLLFRLVVILQLALVRIDEAKSIICRRSKASVLFGVSAVTAIASTRLMQTHERSAANNICKGITLVGILSASRNGWRKLCMNTRLLNTSLILEDWQQQWTLIESVGLVKEGSEEQCKRLLKLMPFQTKSTSIWGSQESFRYNLIKYFMDCLYASFGTAHNVNKSNNKKDSILMPITAAVAASFYAVVGPGAKSAQVLSTSSDYSKMMQDSWGLISTPFCKNFSLHASRLLKGAAIAERIKIAGISCFILSKDPCPALSTAIRRYKRCKKRELDQELDTILEQCPYDDSIDCRAVNFSEYPKKDLIFHLTGGGFFAHTLAGDIPYLLDWSGKTRAIVICPEYALLPKHTFPDAINEVTNVYVSLTNGDATSLLGFRPGRIIVTGESTGGNLAAALNVKLCMDRLIDTEEIEGGLELSESTSDKDAFFKEDKPRVRLPDALMLCCAALNLSLELSPSRVIAHDAVLPSTLISTISNTYLGGISKTDPIASPFYAPDKILMRFPPTLLYASSEDPFLDDSVAFNKRLKSCGVECDLRAAQNMPHAYWGLGTAGFPEARKVQIECIQWMVQILFGKINKV